MLCNQIEIKDRLHDAQRATDQSCAHVGKLYLTFLLFGFYFAITVLSTTHEQLLKETPIELPLLKVELPLLCFYVLAPWLFWLLHLYLLLQLDLLSQKLSCLERYIGLLSDPEERREQRGLVHPFLFSHMLLGHDYRKAVRLLLNVAVWATIVILPVLLLMAVQVKFLPYHGELITWSNRLAVFLDLALLWLFWPAILARHKAGIKHITESWSKTSNRLRIPRFLRPVFICLTHHAFLLLSIFTVAFSLLVATIPDEPCDILSKFVQHPAKWRNLYLPERILVKAEPPPELLAACYAKGKTIKEAWSELATPLDLSGRDLRHANFRRAQLGKAVLVEADLSHADLCYAKLRGAILDFAILQDTELILTRLQGATLRKADMRGAVLDRTHMEDANLLKADLRGADLWGAHLEGANLNDAHLQGQDTRLKHAHLQGAHLWETRLQGAALLAADLRGADLREAKLQGANLSYAHLHAADLRKAELQGADLRSPSLFCADLRDATVSGALFFPRDMRLCDLRGAVFEKLDEKAWKKLREEVAAQAPPEKSEGIHERLKEAEELYLKVKPDIKRADGSLYPRTGPFADWPPPKYDVKQFEDARALALAELACEDEWIAESIAHRIIMERYELNFDRKMSMKLAQALLAQDCTSVVKLPKYIQDSLKEVASMTVDRRP